MAKSKNTPGNLGQKVCRLFCFLHNSLFIWINVKSNGFHGNCRRWTSSNYNLNKSSYWYKQASSVKRVFASNKVWKYLEELWTKEWRQSLRSYVFMSLWLSFKRFRDSVYFLFCWFWTSLCMPKGHATRYALVQCQQWKHQNNLWNLQFKSYQVNRFDTMIWCFYCWLWTNKYQLWHGLNWRHLVWCPGHHMNILTLPWRRQLSYRNQSIDLLCKSMDRFLYHSDLRHERVKTKLLTAEIRYQIKDNIWIWQ